MNEYIRIVAIDPGKTTGYVDLRVNLIAVEITVHNAQEVKWEKRFELLPLLMQGVVHNPDALPDVVVCESFHLYAHEVNHQINSDFPSVRVIGTLEAYLNHLRILNRLAFQSASDIARVAILPEHAKPLGASEHLKDAYKHARYYLLHHRR